MNGGFNTICKIVRFRFSPKSWWNLRYIDYYKVTFLKKFLKINTNNLFTGGLGWIENSKYMLINTIYSLYIQAYFWRANDKQQIVPYLYFYVPWVQRSSQL